MGAKKVIVTATSAQGQSAVVPRDAQKLVTQIPSKSASARKKPHDVHSGGKWIPSFVGLIYDSVEAGDAVEISTKAGESRIETVAYVINSGYSVKHGKPFTKFVTLFDAEGAKMKKIAKLRAELAAAEQS